MKKLLQKTMITAGLLLASSSLMAQTKAALVKNASPLYLSAVAGTNVERYDGQERAVRMSRNIFNGWNTICLPFSMTTEQVNAVFGADCLLESLAGIVADGGNVYLDFADAKAGGIKANIPYILYYTGENKSVTINVNSKIEFVQQPTVSFASNGVLVSFNGAPTQLQADGQYGIYVKDNADANFATVGASTSGFYATRCYITAKGVQNPTFVPRHNFSSATAINTVNSVEAAGDIYSVNGVKQNGLQRGINVVDGKKILVK